MSYFANASLSPPQCVFEAGAKTDHSISLRRNKREWIVPPKILEENEDYTRQESIARVSMHSFLLQIIVLFFCTLFFN